MTTVEFLKSYDPKVQEICLHLREIARELLNDSEEILFAGWKNFSYGTADSRADKDLIIYIAPFEESINLGFYRGANLPDKKKLLKGTGKLLRHLKIKSMADYDISDIEQLIFEAKTKRQGTK
ncbi:DUF1801 domain-containing protein [Arundinibacter roseus]|uniref:DUF1801 domain-containing protein n=1 Tax=Arundinibacter roseus TaxID=2070510 RepID=A0A4R4K7M1_9BACT|nr:DUF1801 domain-containing protein [Arundinibacter roseus]TDB62712.1 DUF1801 domain-containing protein [Arundinibacter roseus]